MIFSWHVLDLGHEIKCTYTIICKAILLNFFVLKLNQYKCESNIEVSKLSGYGWSLRMQFINNKDDSTLEACCQWAMQQQCGKHFELVKWISESTQNDIILQICGLRNNSDNDNSAHRCLGIWGSDKLLRNCHSQISIRVLSSIWRKQEKSFHRNRWVFTFFIFYLQLLPEPFPLIAYSKYW